MFSMHKHCFSFGLQIGRPIFNDRTPRLRPRAELPPTSPFASPAFFFVRQTKGIFMIKKILICLFALSAVSLTACNTVEGAGKDVAATGNAIHDSAKDVKNKM